MAQVATAWAWEMIALPSDDPRHIASPVAALVLLKLADRAKDGTWECWPSIPRIATDVGACVNAVRGGVRDLERAGLVKVSVGGGRKPNTYTLAVVIHSPIVELSTPPQILGGTPPNIGGQPPRIRPRIYKGISKEPLGAQRRNDGPITNSAGDTFLPGSGWVRQHLREVP